MDHDSTDSAVWAQARSRAEILAKLSDRPDDAELREAMRALGISRATLFRWLKRFRQDDRTSTLLPRRRGPSAGMQPLDPAVLVIVEQHFEQLYATRRKPTLTRFPNRCFCRHRAGWRRKHRSTSSRSTIPRWMSRWSIR